MTCSASWLIGRSPLRSRDRPAPARVWVCSTQFASGRALYTPLWMVKPAALYLPPSPRTLPSMSIFTRLEAVISSNISP
jgi:hypothetical protein